MTGLKTAWELAVLTKEPHSVIRVRNLQANVQVGTDAWGRNGKTQPVLISVSASLREPFDTASTEDMVNNSTIHYGILGKAILEATGTFGNIGLKQIGSPAITSTGHSLRSFLEHLSVQLTGCETAGNDVLRPSGPRTLEPSLLQTFEIEVALPKASLFGNGVSLSSTTLYGFESERAGRPHCRTLKLRGLRVPTLIGVNSNERLAKQIVVANIDLEQWEIKTDCYTEIEEIVVKVMSCQCHFRFCDFTKVMTDH
jgi:dihydroneopterin aldolase